MHWLLESGLAESPVELWTGISCESAVGGCARVAGVELLMSGLQSLCHCQVVDRDRGLEESSGCQSNAG